MHHMNADKMQMLMQALSRTAIPNAWLLGRQTLDCVLRAALTCGAAPKAGKNDLRPLLVDAPP